MKFKSWGLTMHLLPNPSPWALPQDSQNCFFCDSRGKGGHGIENVIFQSGPDGNRTWWQAENGEGAGGLVCVGLGSEVRAWSF